MSETLSFAGTHAKDLHGLPGQASLLILACPVLVLQQGCCMQPARPVLG